MRLSTSSRALVPGGAQDSNIFFQGKDESSDRQGQWPTREEVAQCKGYFSVRWETVQSDQRSGVKSCLSFCQNGR